MVEQTQDLNKMLNSIQTVTISQRTKDRNPGTAAPVLIQSGLCCMYV